MSLATGPIESENVLLCLKKILMAYPEKMKTCFSDVYANVYRSQAETHLEATETFFGIFESSQITSAFS